jgi:hypothetical protein
LLVGPLNCNAIDYQASLFGVGLFHMSSPNTINALVQHGHYQVQDRFVQFLNADDAEQNHRATLGF